MITTNIGLLLAGIWFVLTGLFSLAGISFQGQAIVMGILALLAGILLIVGR